MTDNSEWKKEQGKFGLGFILSVIFFIISFFSTPIYDDNELDIDELVFKSAEFLGGKNSRIKISIFGNGDEYEIRSIEKEYLNKALFKKIKYGDTIRVSHVGLVVLRIKFHNQELLNKEKADLHKSQNRMFIRFISLTGILFFIIPAFFETQPTFKFFRRQYDLKMDKYSIGLLIILLLLVTYIVGSPNPEL